LFISLIKIDKILKFHKLVKLRIDGVFGEEKKEEKSLNDFFGK
jgi:hypothetical protein